MRGRIDQTRRKLLRRVPSAGKRLAIAGQGLLQFAELNVSPCLERMLVLRRFQDGPAARGPGGVGSDWPPVSAMSELEHSIRRLWVR